MANRVFFQTALLRVLCVAAIGVILSFDDVSAVPILDTWPAGEGDFTGHQKSANCKSNCPRYVIENLNDNSQPFWAYAGATGMLEITFSTKDPANKNREIKATCTATVISLDAILTNDHCLHYHDADTKIDWDAKSIRLMMNYLVRDVRNSGDLAVYLVDTKPLCFKSPKQTDDCVAQESPQNAMDFVVLEVQGRERPKDLPDQNDRPGGTFKTAPLILAPPKSNDTHLFIVHYPGARAEMYQESCQIYKPGVYPVPSDPAKMNIFRHLCTTEPGSSGALIYRDGLPFPIIALHHVGKDSDTIGAEDERYNESVPLWHILEGGGRDPDGLPTAKEVRVFDYLKKFWEKICVFNPDVPCAVPLMLGGSNAVASTSASVMNAYLELGARPRRILADSDLRIAAGEVVTPEFDLCGSATRSFELSPPTNVITQRVPGEQDPARSVRITGFSVKGSVICDRGKPVSYNAVPASELDPMVPLPVSGPPPAGEVKWTFFDRSRPSKSPNADARLSSEGHQAVRYSAIAPNIWQTTASGETWTQNTFNECTHDESRSYALPGAGAAQLLEFSGPFDSIQTTAGRERCFEHGPLKSRPGEGPVIPGYRSTVVQNMMGLARLKSPACSAHDDAACTLSFDRVETYWNGKNSHPVVRKHIAQTTTSVKKVDDYFVIDMIECDYPAKTDDRRDATGGAGALCTALSKPNPESHAPVWPRPATHITQHFDPKFGVVCENILTDDGYTVTEQNFRVDSWAHNCNTLEHRH